MVNLGAPIMKKMNGKTQTSNNNKKQQTKQKQNNKKHNKNKKQNKIIELSKQTYICNTKLPKYSKFQSDNCRERDISTPKCHLLIHELKPLCTSNLDWNVITDAISLQ